MAQKKQKRRSKSMSGAEIAILAVVCVAFVAAVAGIIVGKIKHKGGCGCDCGGSCSSCRGCAAVPVKAEEKPQTPCPHCAEHNNE